MPPRCCFLRHLFFLLLVLSPWTPSCGGAADESTYPLAVTRVDFRSLQEFINEPSKPTTSRGHTQPTEPNTNFVVDRDGKVSLKQQASKQTIWSFSTGSPLYSLYQAPLGANNNTENATEISRPLIIVDYVDSSTAATVDGYHNWAVGDFFRQKPLVTDGGVTLGSETTTAYLVDGESGRLIHVYKSTHSSEDTKLNNALVKPTSNVDFLKLPLLIRRTDSKLEHFGNATGKLAWNFTVSHFRAAFLCDPVFNSGYDLGPRIQTGIYMPLPCGSQIDVPGPELVIRVPYDEPMKVKMLHLESENSIMLSERSIEARKLQEQHGQEHGYVFGKVFEWSFVKLLVPLVLLGVVVSVFIKRFSSRGSDFSLKSGPSKKKKNRRSGNRQSVPHGQDQFELIEGGQMLLGFNNFQSGPTPGRKIGKLFVSSKEIAKGSNGTVVFEGIYEGRPVAVKRLVRSHHEVAFKEIQNLIASDQHSNIIRWYGVEYDQDFVYLSLERCTCSLDDLIKSYLEYSMTKILGNNESTEAVASYKIQLDSLEGVIKGNNFWNVGGRPSPFMLNLMRDMVYGVVHLHKLGIVHRDLKPQNVLISKEMTAKLSDMGISKRMSRDMSSLGQLATGSGSSGWQAPEQLLQGRQTRAVDMFSLGCVIFYTITGCKHPFGDDLERDVNIVKNKVDLFLVEHVPEASDLISRLLDPNPDLRPSATEVVVHPMFWDSETRLSFLRDASDRVELENREADSEILKAMESTAPVAIGGKWDEKLEPDFITNLGSYRRYKYDSIRDLLRVIRNKLNHYRELPPEIQELVGTVPEGYDEYFAVRFPKLLIEVYKVISLHCKEEEVFRKYFKCNII
ncbi:PREDICTED: serine/threonine-protein kinase/endoribonuclease IRE1a [Camelina sativa]|uniref:Serine/threonine-protein kinase/endoribonuclease IRE1a n=1 Tax=Camelina sativa TaxID=90675 RepID=A0ABM0W980_CAMSA|nr:PREDICTED: serine/threonine-protein kinase/endoribonuclease IRE1a [Camelina sativa]